MASRPDGREPSLPARRGARDTGAGPSTTTQRAAAGAEVEALRLCDYVVDIELDEVTPRVWRRVRLSGGINLNTLEDKVLVPVMGWYRHYHGYLYTDVQRGTRYGPAMCDAIDMMHISMRGGHDFKDDTKYCLADLLRKPGDKARWDYDLGDGWRHMLTLVEVVPQQDSTGACVLLDGEMSGPPEDSYGLDGMGNQAFQKLLDKLQAAKTKEKRKTLLRGCHQALNIPDDCEYDPFDPFDVAPHQGFLQYVFRTRASAPYGYIQWNLINAMGGLGFPQFGTDQMGPPRMEESSRKELEPVELALCAQCGTPHNLAMCGGCRDVRFCGKDCQAAAWKEWHKAECKTRGAAQTRTAGRASTQ